MGFRWVGLEEEKVVDLVCMVAWFWFFKVYLFIMYVVLCLHVCWQARKGHQISL